MRDRMSAWLLAGAVAAGGLASAEAVERPFALTVERVDTGERLRGRVVEADEVGLRLETAGGVEALAWSAVDAAALMRAKGRLLSRDDGRGWVDAAWVLAGRGEAGPALEGALGRALRADRSLGEEVARVRAGEPPTWWEPDADHGSDAEAGRGPGADTDQPGADPDKPGGHTHGGEGPPAVEGGSAGVPETIGDIQLERWGPLSPELMEQGLREQEAFLAETMARTGLRLDLYGDASEHFLLATDLKAAEARRWAGELDRMYEVMCGMFELPPEERMFYGKAVIVIFRDDDDYHRWNAGAFGDPIFGSLGVCFSMGDGHVRISFFRQRDTAKFAHLLVHETTHGFLHRYRGPTHVPSWLNEGLAETISRRLFPGAEDPAMLRRVAARYAGPAVQRPSSFFDARNIPGPYYPVAHHLVEWMLHQDGKRFKAMMDAVKDGKDAAAALEEDFGVPGPRLLRLFAEEIQR